MREDGLWQDMLNDIYPTIQLMCKDTLVMEFNLTEGTYLVRNEPLLPYTLKGRIRKMAHPGSMTHREAVQYAADLNHNRNCILSWLASRTLPLSRANAKYLYNLLGFDQISDDITKARISIECRAVSLQDNYWIRLPGESKTWRQTDLRENPLNEIFTQVALHGVSLTFTGDFVSPEMSTYGAYPKAWFRESDGLYLYKRGSVGSYESRVEVMCSNLLDKMPVDHLRYSLAAKDGYEMCKCKCMTTEELSILPAMDFYVYCNANHLDFYDEIMKIDSDAIYRMWIVDYLISNRDRHSMNWGFFYDSDTTRIIGCHPLFDHNNSFDIEYMRDDLAYLFDSRMTMKEAACEAMRHVDFYLKEEVTRKDFITARQYESFLKKANEIGLRLGRREGQ